MLHASLPDWCARSKRLSRRLTLGLAGSSLLPLPRLAAWPDRPVRFIVPFAPGGPIDVVARVYTDAMQAKLSQTLLVENRSGGGGNPGARMVAQAPDDSSTLLVAIDTLVTANSILYPDAGFDPSRDFVPIALFGTMASAVTVHPSVPARTIADLVSLARERPLNYGSGGIGTPGHLYGEFLRTATGAQLNHVPYRGLAPAVTDLLAGRIQLIVALLPGVLAHVQAGRLVTLAQMGAERSTFLPDVPTLSETILPGFDGSSWIALFGPARLPPEASAVLSREVASAAVLPNLRQRLATLAFEASGAGPDRVNALMRRDQERWGRVIRDAGIRPE